MALWHRSQGNPCCIIQHCSQTCLIKDPGHGPWFWVWGFEWQICCQLSTNRHRPRVSTSFRFSFSPLQTWQKLAPAPASTSASTDSSLGICPTRDKHQPNCPQVATSLPCSWFMSWNAGFLFWSGKKTSGFYSCVEYVFSNLLAWRDVKCWPMMTGNVSQQSTHYIFSNVYCLLKKTSKFDFQHGMFFKCYVSWFNENFLVLGNSQKTFFPPW